MQKREHWASLLKVTKICEWFPVHVYECIAHPRNTALKRGDKITHNMNVACSSTPTVQYNQCTAVMQQRTSIPLVQQQSSLF